MNNKRPSGIHFDRKIVVVLDENTPRESVLSIVAHILMSLGFYAKDAMGEEIKDKSGTVHSSLSKYPMVILSASSERINSILSATKEQRILTVDFPKLALDIWIDEELVATMSLYDTNEIDCWGIAIYGSPKSITKLTGDLKLFKI
jgi:hypothetical protein